MRWWRRLEAGFLLAGAAKASAGGDSGYVAGCLFRAVGVLAQVLHARAGRWLVNEKGMITAAGRCRAPRRTSRGGRRHSSAPSAATPPSWPPPSARPVSWSTEVVG